MKKYMSRFLFFVVLIAFVACQKDTDEFIPNSNTEEFLNDINGIVVDENNIPINNAMVEFGNLTTFTNSYGVYQFEEVNVDSRHNFIAITKEGYFKGNRTFRNNKEGTIDQQTQLLKKSFDLSFNSSVGGVLEHNFVKLDFKPNSVVFDSSNEEYNGQVMVAVKTLDPTALETTSQMPGDLSALDSEGNYSALTSYGMVYVELESDSGEKLQVKEGSTVTMTNAVNADILSSAPETIKMWSFDYNSGLWKEETTATLQGGTYVAEIPHFSCWNYDFNLPAVNVTLKLVNEDGDPLVGLHVWITLEDSYGGGHGYTNGDGTISGAVSKDVDLVLKIVDGKCDYDNPIYEAPIGPFSTDTDLGEIVLITDPANTYKISGTFINCDGNEITNGYVQIDSRRYFIDSGDFSAEIVDCDRNAQVDFQVVDLDQLKTSSITTITTSGEVDLGVVTVCGEEPLFFQIKCDDLGIDELALYELVADAFPTEKRLFAFSSDTITQNEILFLEMRYADTNMSDFALGTFDVNSGTIENNWNGSIAFTATSGTVTIDEYNSTDRYIRGSYQVKFKDEATGLIEDFYGRFKLNAGL